MTTHSKRPAAGSAMPAGFTLIELMIVVAIIGVLAMIGLPSYDRYIIRSNRAVAKQFLLQVATKQEQYMLDARQYATSITGSGAGSLNLTPPAELSNRYTFTLAACAAPCTTYTITATPIGSQVPDLYDPIGKTSNNVGPLTLDNLGSKNPAVKWRD